MVGFWGFIITFYKYELLWSVVPTLNVFALIWSECVFSLLTIPQSLASPQSLLCPSPPAYFQISHNLSFGSLIIPATESGITLNPAVQIINKCSCNWFCFSNLRCPYFSLEFAQRPPFSIYFRASHCSTQGWLQDATIRIQGESPQMS